MRFSVPHALTAAAHVEGARRAYFTSPLLDHPFDAAGGRSVLQRSCFFACRDDFWFAVVGRAGSLRPIVNRPNATNFQHSSFAPLPLCGAGCLTCGRLSIGQADCVQRAGRRVANPPQDTILPHVRRAIPLSCRTSANLC
jgi:hypothetical protein